MRSFTEAELRDGFAVRYSPEKGRHLIAARAFSPGAIILQQDPYAAVLTDERTPGYCDYCFRQCERPLRCSRSKLARYCCKEHQRLAWAAGYKVECEALVRCAPRVPPPTVRLAARVLWRRGRALQQQQQHSPPSPPPPQQQRPPEQPVQRRGLACEVPGSPLGPDDELHPHVHHVTPLDSEHEGLLRLEHHWDQLDDGRKSIYAQMAVVTWQYMYGAPDGPCPADVDDSTVTSSAGGAATPPGWLGFRAVAQLLSRLACNCHTVCDEELRPLGTALYPTGALVNHSCQPNALQTFRGSTLQLRALASLSPSDEVTISYVELAATRQERREALAESYFFDVNVTRPLPLAPPLSPLVESQLPPAPAADVIAAGVTLAAQPAAEGPQEAEAAMEVDGPSQGAAGNGSGEASGSGSPIRVSSRVGAGGSSGDGGGCGGAGHVAAALRPPPVLSLEVAANSQLYVYATNADQPPWPTDPRDGELTRVAVAARADVDHDGAEDAVQRGAEGVRVTLGGGLLARLVPRRPNEPNEAEEEEESEQGDGGGEDKRRGDGRVPSGADGRSLCADAGEGGLHGGPSRSSDTDMVDAGEHEPPEATRPPARKRPPPALQLPAAALSAGAGPGPGPGGLRWPRIELLAWGPWVLELVRAADSVAQPQAGGAGDGSGDSRGGGGGVGSDGGLGATLKTAAVAATPSHPAVAALLRRCVHALHLAHQAEGASGSGEDAEAVDLLQRALQLLDGRTTPPPSLALHHHHLERWPQPGGNSDGRRDGVVDSDRLLVLGPNHILRLRLQAQLLKAAVDLASKGCVTEAFGGSPGESAGGGTGPRVWGAAQGGGGPWEAALRAARALETAYRLVYSQPAWPNLTLHYATLAKLEMLLGRPRRALRAAGQALVGLRLTHSGGRDGGGGGGAGGVVDQVVRVGQEAEAELRMRGQSGEAEDGQEEEEEGETGVWGSGRSGLGAGRIWEGGAA